MVRFIYKICDRSVWQEAEQTKIFKGAGIDITDGYIHFSTAQQIAETLALHFAQKTDLLLIEIDSRLLSIKWEPSRGGQLFPHLYDALPLSAVSAVWPLELGPDGQHNLPELQTQY